MPDDQIVGRGFEIVIGPEAEIVVLLLRRRVDPPALVPAEGLLFVVARDDVLPELRTDGLEHVSKMSDDGKVSQDRVVTLHEVVSDDSEHHEREAEEDPHFSLSFIILPPSCLLW